MEWKQLVPINLDPYIYYGGVVLKSWLGWCLGYVTAATDTPAEYRVWRAIQAWNGCQYKHENRDFPKDVYFLIWFDHYGIYDNSGDNSWGHVCLAYYNSTTGVLSIWSSPISEKATADTWSSIEQVERNYSSRYLGWSEDNNGYRIIEPVEIPVVGNNQVIVTSELGINGRVAPDSNSAQAVDSRGNLREYKKGDILTFDYVVRGNDPYGDGRNLWGHGAFTDTFWWLSATNKPNGKGFEIREYNKPMPEPAPVPEYIPPEPTPQPEPEPTPEPTKPDPRLLDVVNKKNPMLPLNYAPDDLVDVGGGQKLRKEAAEAFRKMQYESGDNIYIRPASGYRSYDKQLTIYTDYLKTDLQEVVDTYSARPGYSEHQTGLVMDIDPIDDAFANTPQYAWLKEHAHEYGFIERYPKGKEAITGYKFEPWHWRYVGKEAAAAIHKSGQTLEEYMNVPGGDYSPAPGQVVVSDLDRENNTLLKQILEIVKSILEKITSIFK